MNIAVVVNEKELVEVLKRVYGNSHKNILERELETTIDNFRSLDSKVNDRGLLVIENEGFAVVSLHEKVEVQDTLDYLNNFRLNVLDKKHEIKLISYDMVMNEFDRLTVTRSMEMLAEAIIKGGDR